MRERPKNAPVERAESAGLLGRWRGAVERALIFRPVARLDGSPADRGLAFEDVLVDTDDGARLHGWHVPGRRPVTLLYCHGNAGNVSHRLAKLEALHRHLGVSVLLFDYRGYGRSSGRPSEAGTYADARAMRTWLARAAPGPVVYTGESLGTAVATALAVDDPPAALVLEAPFTSVRALASALLPGAGRLFRNRYDTLAAIARVRAPVLVLHGDADEVVPPDQGRAVFAAAPQPKSLAVVPGAHHNDAYLVGGEIYWQAWEAFLAGHVPGWST
jgi:uncharacterized protein